MFSFTLNVIREDKGTMYWSIVLTFGASTNVPSAFLVLIKLGLKFIKIAFRGEKNNLLVLFNLAKKVININSARAFILNYRYLGIINAILFVKSFM